MTTKRSIGISILLSIITCGLYSLFWFICLNDEVNIVSGEREATSGGMALLFNIITCGIYGLYWAYTMGRRVSLIQAQNGQMADSALPILYLILNLFGLSIVTYALIQNELNKV